jgi:nitroreductase
MNINQAIKQRHSCRAYTDKAVTKDQINRILTTASQAPSGANTQPWQVAVVTGQTKQALQDAIQQAFASGIKPNPDYPYYPTQWQAPYTLRRKQCGLQLYNSLAIKREDTARRQAQWAANYRAFDAPVMLLFLMDNIMQTGSYLDYGMFLQSVMLSAMTEGLATCPQAALAEYPDIIRQTLNYPNSKQVLCGIAMGYEDSQDPVNQYRTDRDSTSQFTDFFD